MVQCTETTVDYKDPAFPVEKRIAALVKQMTLEEKILQLTQLTIGDNDNVNNVGQGKNEFNPAIGSFIYSPEEPSKRNTAQKAAIEQTRLGIPILMGYDVIHGFRTVYPIPLAQACSWNPELTRQASEVAAREARAAGVDWTFSPMIDIARDGRWGRIAEGYGEDPYTASVFTVAAVRGYQGDDPYDMAALNKIAACLKHYVGYGRSEGGRDYTRAELSRQSLWDTYLPPYEAGVKAGAATLMSAFNDISGIPASANYYTLTEILKKQWRHDGFVVSDWGAVTQLIQQGYAADNKDAALKAFTAGVEMDMVDNCYKDHLAELVAEGKVSPKLIDDAVARVLRVKFRLGLFENPYTPETKENERFLLPEYRRIAQQAAEETIVLLKNSNNTLPIEKAKSIAVIGPMAKSAEDLLGSWAGHGHAEDVTSLYDAIVNEFAGKALVSYAQGCDFDGDDTKGFAQALSVARAADVVLLCLGEKRSWSGENASRSTIALPAVQEQLAAALKQCGKPVVLLLTNGRPLDLHTLEPVADAIVELWQPGVPGGVPAARVLSGAVNPSGKLAVTFPYSTGQIPIYYNERQSSRPFMGHYQDIPSQPLFPFAYGLSYSEFQYGKLTADKTTLKADETLTLEIPVKNASVRDGAETVHWFVTDPVCSVTRPLRELRYFSKSPIKAGETQTFRFELQPQRDLCFVNEQGEKILEPGRFIISVKEQSIEIELKNN